MEKRFLELKDKIEKTFAKYPGAPWRTDENDNEVLLEEELRELLGRYSDVAQVSCVEKLETFESCGYSCGVISVAFTNPITGLETYLEQWEVC